MSTPNFQITDKDTNKKYWIARNVAVCVIPFFAKSPTEIYVPLGQRSQKLELYPGYWGLPCGYLDWDESLQEAAKREVNEELGLDLTGIINPQPDYVTSNPKQDELQNVTCRFITYSQVKELPTLITSNETPQVKWLELSDLFFDNLAFNHKEIIEWAYQRLREYRTL